MKVRRLQDDQSKQGYQYSMIGYNSAIAFLATIR